MNKMKKKKKRTQIAEIEQNRRFLFLYHCAFSILFFDFLSLYIFNICAYQIRIKQIFAQHMVIYIICCAALLSCIEQSMNFNNLDFIEVKEYQSPYIFIQSTLLTTASLQQRNSL